MPAPRVLLVVAHPVIASGIETLLKLEGDYDIKRVPSVGDAVKSRDWKPDAALVDGTLLQGLTEVTIGAPAYVLSGSERDGRQLARRLEDGRGWLRKDATGAELANAVTQLMRGDKGDKQDANADASLGTLGVITVVVLAIVVLALVAYLVWLAIY